MLAVKRLSAVCTLVLVMLPRLVLAQENVQPGTIATVTHLAGQNVYLDIGTEQGVADGDTLHVAGEEMRRLLVVTSAQTRSVCVFAGAAFPVTRGQQLPLLILKGKTSDVSAADLGAEQGGEFDGEDAKVEGVVQPPVQEGPVRAPVTQARKRAPVTVDGRLLMRLSLLNSETQIRSSSVPAVSRRYATPSVSLNATVRNLPSGAKLNLHIRTDYRYQSRSPLERQGVFRAYTLSLEKDFGFAEIQAGRFYNRLVQRGGYWDGVSLLAGSRQKGIGAAFGFMPERSNEGFTTQFPRYAVFAHYETPRDAGLRYRGSVAWHEIQPSTLLLTHRFAGLEQQVNWAFVAVDQDLQLDQDPVSKQWVVSHFMLGTSLRLGDQVRLRGRYALRQPYRIYNVTTPFLTRRDQYLGGITFDLARISFGARYTVRQLNQVYEGETISGHFHTRPLTRFALSFTGSATRWTSDFGTALYINGGVSRNFGRIYTRTDYGFYRSMSPNLDNPIDMHRLSLSLALPINRSMHWRFSTNYNQSQLTQSFSLNTSLLLRF